MFQTFSAGKAFLPCLLRHCSTQSFIRIYYTDGTSSSNILVGTHAVGRYKVYEFFAGYESLAIASRIGQKTPLKYTFWLEDDAGNVKSQVRTYEIEFRSLSYERTFIFRNSFGAYDVLQVNRICGIQT